MVLIYWNFAESIDLEVEAENTSTRNRSIAKKNMQVLILKVMNPNPLQMTNLIGRAIQQLPQIIVVITRKNRNEKMDIHLTSIVLKHTINTGRGHQSTDSTLVLDGL